ncbi:MAG: RNA-binding protein [Pseudomonadota bacterium]
MSERAEAAKTRQGRERRCLVLGESRSEAELIRFAVSPDGIVTPDIRARLPGRGAWVSADEASVTKAAAKGLFNRAFERKVQAPDDLAAQCGELLAQRALQALGLARRAGKLALGYDAARLALKSAARPAWRIEARDAARDGRAKLDRLSAAAHGPVPVAGCFDSAALGAAVGRPGVMHGVLAQSGEARAFGAVMKRLTGFRVLDPAGTAQEGRTGANTGEAPDKASGPTEDES